MTRPFKGDFFYAIRKYYFLSSINAKAFPDKDFVKAKFY